MQSWLCLLNVAFASTATRQCFRSCSFMVLGNTSQSARRTLWTPITSQLSPSTAMERSQTNLPQSSTSGHSGPNWPPEGTPGPICQKWPPGGTRVAVTIAILPGHCGANQPNSAGSRRSLANLSHSGTRGCSRAYLPKLAATGHSKANLPSLATRGCFWAYLLKVANRGHSQADLSYSAPEPICPNRSSGVL